MLTRVSKQQKGMTLGRWLMRGPRRREVLPTSTTHAREQDVLPGKQTRTVVATTTSVLCVASKAINIGTAPKVNRVRRGKASMSRATARLPCSSSS